MAPYHYNGLSARLEEYMVQTEIWEKICLSQCSTRGAVDPRLDFCLQLGYFRFELMLGPYITPIVVPRP